VQRSTPDALALAFLMLGLLFHRRGRLGLAVVALVLAVLTRETSIIAAAAVAFAELRKARVLAACLAGGVPLAAYLTWQAAVARIVGGRFDPGYGNVGIPFAWLPAKLEQILRPGDPSWMELWGLLAVLFSAAGLVVVLLQFKELDAPRLTFVGFATLGLFLSFNVYGEAFSYGRALVVLPALAPAIAAGFRTRLARAFLVAITAFYALAGLVVVHWGYEEAKGGRSLWTTLLARPSAAATAPQSTP
jgi:hypothetical protein